VRELGDANHCPGTGEVGAAIDRAIDSASDSSTCGACAMQGKCEVVKIERLEKAAGKAS
jgi:hypothetical protein